MCFIKKSDKSVTMHDNIEGKANLDKRRDMCYSVSETLEKNLCKSIGYRINPEQGYCIMTYISLSAIKCWIDNL